MILLPGDNIIIKHKFNEDYNFDGRENVVAIHNSKFFSARMAATIKLFRTDSYTYKEALKLLSAVGLREQEYLIGILSDPYEIQITHKNLRELLNELQNDIKN